MRGELLARDKDTKTMICAGIDPTGAIRIGGGFFNSVYVVGDEVVKLPTPQGRWVLNLMSDGDPCGITESRIDICSRYFPTTHTPTQIRSGKYGWVLVQPHLRDSRNLTIGDISTHSTAQDQLSKMIEENRIMVGETGLCLDLVGFYSGARIIARGIAGLPPNKNHDIANLMIDPQNRLHLVDHDLLETQRGINSPQGVTNIAFLTAERLAIRYATGHDLLQVVYE